MYFLCISKIILILSITYISHTTAIEPITQVVCDEAESGELHFSENGECLRLDTSALDNYDVRLSKRCVDIKLLEVVMCKDGTLRKKVENLCLTAPASGTGNLYWKPCELYRKLESVIESQKWKKEKQVVSVVSGSGAAVVSDGVRLEEQFKIKDKKSSKCMTKNSYLFNLELCDDANKIKQLFYFKTTKIIKKGKIMYNEIFIHHGIHNKLKEENKKHLFKQCLSMKYDDEAAKRIVQFQSCFPNKEDSSFNQEFTLYDTGYLAVKSKKKDWDWCVRETKTGKQLVADECSNAKKWEYNYCNGDICSLHIKDTDRCLDGSVLARNSLFPYFKKCNYSPLQRFQWISGMFSNPELTYFKRGCNENGKISMEIATEWSYSESEDKGVEDEISGSLSFEYGHFSGDAGYERTNSLVNAWEKRNATNSKMVMTCETYKDGGKFVGGCLWQLEVKMINMKNNGIFDWKPKVIACTPDFKQPKCEAFTKCSNPPSCTKCVPTALEQQSEIAKAG